MRLDTCTLIFPPYICVGYNSFTIHATISLTKVIVFEKHAISIWKPVLRVITERTRLHKIISSSRHSLIHVKNVQSLKTSGTVNRLSIDSHHASVTWLDADRGHHLTQIPPESS